MHTDDYTPMPLDISDVELSEDLLILTERLAKNIHEVWAKSRMDQGWTYGPTRDDARKKHPCLIPYEELPEEEKKYDRNTALGTLKFVIKQGFEVKK